MGFRSQSVSALSSPLLTGIGPRIHTVVSLRFLQRISVRIPSRDRATTEPAKFLIPRIIGRRDPKFRADFEISGDPRISPQPMPSLIERPGWREKSIFYGTSVIFGNPVHEATLPRCDVRRIAALVCEKCETAVKTPLPSKKLLSGRSSRRIIRRLVVVRSCHRRAKT